MIRKVCPNCGFDMRKRSYPRLKYFHHVVTFSDRYKLFKPAATKHPCNHNTRYTMIPHNTNIKIKQIPGFQDYFATTDGKIFSTAKRFNSPNPSVPRQLKSWKNRGKHLAVSLVKDGVIIRRYVHSLILETFVGKCKVGQMCRHLDGNGLNNNLSNLKWGTMKENQMDRIVHGTDNRGEKHGMSRLTIKNVIKIRKLFAAANTHYRKKDKGVNYKEIAIKFNVAPSTIRNIVRGLTWGWLK